MGFFSLWKSMFFIDIQKLCAVILDILLLTNKTIIRE